MGANKKYTALSVGLLIKRALEPLGFGVYNLIAPLNSKSPFIVYRRVGLKLEGDKSDAEAIEKALIEVAVINDNYSEGVHLAEEVRAKLETLEEKGEVYEISLIDSVEEYDFNAGQFLQVLTYEIEINKDNSTIWEE